MAPGFDAARRETGPPSVNPWQWWDPATIARATSCPQSAVEANWPLLASAMVEQGVWSRNSAAGMAATVSVESASRFAPIHEFADGDPYAYFESHYGYLTSIGRQLGNTAPGDGYKFRGAGFIQATGKGNAITYGAILGLDIVNNPDLMIEPGPSARFAAAYWKQRGIMGMCDAGRWEDARRAVNGGLNGYPRFYQIVTALLG